jgi:uncharacterized protein (TIGR02452 family)
VSVKFYNTDYVFSSPKSQYVTKIEIQDLDTIGAAKQFENACCLNFASHKRPGGGYESVKDIPMPIKTQEEDLFRRSNLPELMDNPKIRANYPLKGIKGFYTTDIVVNKDQKLQQVTPFNISLVTVPAVVNPDSVEDFDLVKKKAIRILEIAADNNHKDLILGAWGCGIFGNNPKHIAELFFELLKNEFSGVFESVIFAIPGKGSKNYQMFESVIC